jgi:hypothetical protein
MVVIADQEYSSTDTVLDTSRNLDCIYADFDLSPSISSKNG